MSLPEADMVVMEIESLLKKHNIHYRVERVMCPDLRFINFSEISIKVMKG